ncbi:hypothetical protein GW17_00052207, partial [Ensete ventricosum]
CQQRDLSDASVLSLFAQRCMHLMGISKLGTRWLQTTAAATSTKGKRWGGCVGDNALLDVRPIRQQLTEDLKRLPAWVHVTVCEEV